MLAESIIINIECVCSDGKLAAMSHNNFSFRATFNPFFYKPQRFILSCHNILNKKFKCGSEGK